MFCLPCDGDVSKACGSWILLAQLQICVDFDEHAHTCVYLISGFLIADDIAKFWKTENKKVYNS